MPGLVVESETVESLVNELSELIPQLMELNGIPEYDPEPIVRAQRPFTLAVA